MSEQISFFDTRSEKEKKAEKELLFLNRIFPQLKQAIKEHDDSADLLSLNVTQGYSAVFLSSFTLFRLHFRGKQHYISIPIVFSDLIPASMPKKSAKSEPKYVRIPVDEENPLEGDESLLIDIARECVTRYPKEWDCCSRYMECSDAKKCVHPDKAFALGCGYRKVLQSGRIFYGSNRNVD